MKDISITKVVVNYLLYIVLLLGLLMVVVFPIKSQIKPDTTETITGAEFVYQQF